MRIKQFSILFITAFILTGSVSAGKLQLEIKPGFSYMFGKASYALDATAFVQSIQETQRITSLLEFPLDVITTELSFDLYNSQNNERWKLSASVGTNLIDPSGQMTDSDWLGISNLLPYTKFSYTESDVEMKLWNFDASFTYKFYEENSLSLAFVGGGRYNYFKQNIIGYTGWQMVPDLINYDFSPRYYFSGNEPAIDYTLKVMQGYFGIKSIIKNGTTQAELMTAFAPVSFKDVDDHLLRFKESVADGTGNGLIINGAVKFLFNQQRATYLKLSFDMNHYLANGKQTQTWYDDEYGIDPQTGLEVIIAEQGKEIPNIPHEVKSTTVKLSAQIGFMF